MTRFEFLLPHLAVTDTDARLRTDPLNEIRQRIDRLHAIVDDVNLAAALQFEVDGILDNRRFELHDDRLNGQTIARRGLDDGHVAQAAQRHVQRSGDRRRRHRDNVHLFLDLLQPFFVGHTEALLFVDDHQTEILKLHVLRKQPMRADDDVRPCRLQPPRELSFCSFGGTKRLSIAIVTGNAANRSLKVSKC